MNFFRVGVVDFFGILCPGILLLGDLSILLWIFTAQETNLGTFFSGVNGALLFLVVFVLAYLFGFALRLISPDYVDSIGTWLEFRIDRYSRNKRDEWWEDFKGRLSNNGKHPPLKLKEKKREFKRYIESECYTAARTNFKKSFPGFYWLEERYPYYVGTKYIYQIHLGTEIANLLMQQSPKFHNKETYNFWKTYLVSKDPNLASVTFQAEAFVRFMSGSFWAVAVSIFPGILLVLRGAGCSADQVVFGILLMIISLILLVILLRRFKNQRRREVKVLLDSILTLYLNGTHPNSRKPCSTP